MKQSIYRGENMLAVTLENLTSVDLSSRLLLPEVPLDLNREHSSYKYRVEYE